MNLPFPVRAISIPSVIQAINFSLAITGGIAAAYWSWQLWDLSARSRFMVPAQQHQSASDTLAPVSAPHSDWFGGGSVNVDAAQTRQNMKLIGTFAGNDRSPGYAIITFNNGSALTFQQGMEIAKGEVIDGIFPAYLILKRNGTVERLDIDRKPTPSRLIQAVEPRGSVRKVTAAP